MKTPISFVAPVNCRSDLDTVIPNTALAFACDLSNPDVHAFFVYSDGKWSMESATVLEQEVYVRLGDQIKLMRADGKESDAVFTCINGKMIAHEIHDV